MVFHIPRKNIRPAFLALATACVSLSIAPHAFAGFEWTPPPAPMRAENPPVQTQSAPAAAAPVKNVEGSMLPLPVVPPPAAPASAAAPVKNNMPPPMMPAAQPMPEPVPAQMQQPVIKTISVQPPMPLAKAPPPPAPAPQAMMPEPAPAQPIQTQAQDTGPVPLTAGGQPYVAQESVKKRIHYSEWLTEAQAQEMSMKINKPEAAPPEAQKAPLAMEESTHLVVPQGTPLAAPAPQGNSDVMSLLTPQDLVIAPYPQQRMQQVQPAPAKIVMPEDAPEKAKTIPSSVPKKSNPPAPAKAKKTAPKKEAAAKKTPEQAKKTDNFNGFGTDIPLAFAMEQILPEDYKFDFADGVNPEQRVSWQGGKPWKDVIGEILEKSNLASRTEGKTVHIVPKS